VNTSFLEGADNSIAVVCDDFAVEKPNTMYVGNYEMYPNFLSGGSVRNVSTNYNATKDDWLIICDTSGGSVTMTLPDPTGLSGKHWIFKKISSSHSVIVATSTTAQIDGSDSHSFNQQYGFDWVVCDGTNFHIISEGH
jgi:hypothetical protein